MIVVLGVVAHRSALGLDLLDAAQALQRLLHLRTSVWAG